MSDVRAWLAGVLAAVAVWLGVRRWGATQRARGAADARSQALEERHRVDVRAATAEVEISRRASEELASVRATHGERITGELTDADVDALHARVEARRRAR